MHYKLDDPPPSLHDLPFLVAVLVGSIRTDDELLRELAEEWLDTLGVSLTFTPDSPVIRPCPNPGPPRRLDGRRPTRGTS